ncbi:ABC transporter permease [Cystobacter ferrugineus]|uniref:ABC transporter permease n=1 Tax=Cystobacter ferrugineus TaxID=83449 RepID=A0A1L9BJX2_9BACT|nr:ABC transporter permease [Cystobacter ferrugineus]OJH42571.1 ABC transporter permease [Cystobacter ferrugineus]
MSATASVEAPRAWWLARWGERLNPLVVKEVRQGLRSRVFWLSFGLMLLACFIISLAAYVATLENSLRPQGRTYFLAFFFCLGVVHFFLLPYGAYRSLSREREEETWVLLLLTGLGPRRILRGKVASCLVQGGLYASAVGPFLLFSYYLNGIDLPTLLLVLGLGACWFLFLTVVAVCAATLAEGRMGRGFAHLALLGALGLGLVYGQTIAYVLCEQGFRSLSTDEEVLDFALGSLWLMLTCAWLLFETAAARLSLPTENYSWGPRRALVVQTVLSVLVVLCCWWDSSSRRMAWGVSVLGCGLLTLCGLVLATDLDGQARSLRAATRPWSLLRPGALRGFRLAVLLLLFWTAACGVLFVLSTRHRSIIDLPGVIALPLYALLYLSLPLWVARLPRSPEFSSPALVRLLFFVIGGLGLLVSSLLSFVLWREEEGHTFLSLLNPFLGVICFAYGDPPLDEPVLAWRLLGCVGLLAALSVFLADRSLAAREREVHAA